MTTVWLLKAPLSLLKVGLGYFAVNRRRTYFIQPVTVEMVCGCSTETVEVPLTRWNPERDQAHRANGHPGTQYGIEKGEEQHISVNTWILNDHFHQTKCITSPPPAIQTQWVDQQVLLHSVCCGEMEDYKTILCINISTSTDLIWQVAAFLNPEKSLIHLSWLNRLGQRQNGGKSQTVSCKKVIKLLRRALIQDPDVGLMRGYEETASLSST